jgi:hypothetical protein
MMRRILCLIAICSATALFALAQANGLEGKWMTEGVPAVEAAIKAKSSLSGLPEGTRIQFKVDVKKGKISGTILQLNSNKEFDVADGKLTDNTFTFNAVEVLPIGFGNNNNRNNNQQQPLSIPWKGELTDPNTVTLTRVLKPGETANPLVLKRAPK